MERRLQLPISERAAQTFLTRSTDARLPLRVLHHGDFRGHPKTHRHRNVEARNSSGAVPAPMFHWDILICSLAHLGGGTPPLPVRPRLPEALPNDFERVNGHGKLRAGDSCFWQCLP
jgi:hypothetical protein